MGVVYPGASPYGMGGVMQPHPSMYGASGLIYVQQVNTLVGKGSSPIYINFVFAAQHGTLRGRG